MIIYKYKDNDVILYINTEILGKLRLGKYMYRRFSIWYMIFI